MEDSAASSPQPSSAYAKRPLWQWFALYAVIAVVVYAAIYYLFLSKKGPSPYTVAPTPEAIEQQEVPPADAVTAEEAGVSLTAAGFNPQTLTITAGTQVVWTNTSGAVGNVSSAPHPAHTAYPPLNLGSFDGGATVSLVFDQPGTYKYHNHLNPTQTGSITVE